MFIVYDKNMNVKELSLILDFITINLTNKD